MSIEYTVGKSLPRSLCKWWKRARPSRRGTQLNNGMPPCLELYVPWWAWPLELMHRAVFGNPKLNQIEGEK